MNRCPHHPSARAGRRHEGRRSRPPLRPEGIHPRRARAVPTVQRVPSGATFADEFWPALWATLVGAALGFGLALWGDRRAKRHAENKATFADRERLREARSVLNTANDENMAMLQLLRDRVDSGALVLATHLDLGAWEALRDDYLRLCPSYQRTRLADNGARFALAGCDRAVMAYSVALLDVQTRGLSSPAAALVGEPRAEVLAAIDHALGVVRAAEEVFRHG